MKNSDSPITSNSWILGFKNFKFEREISASFLRIFSRPSRSLQPKFRKRTWMSDIGKPRNVDG